VNRLGADYVWVSFTAFREREHNFGQVLSAILVDLIWAKTKLGARLGICVAQRHKLLIVEKFGEHGILRVL
jgi:hypothetical protein